MLTEKTMERLRILAESAKYDVSCSSSGTVRSGKKGMVGSTVGGVGICHSFADDGRCISLLKVMLTNYCMYDCAYCINRRTNDIPRATLSVSELEEITMEFYRRNYIEGLFLSSGVVRNPKVTGTCPLSPSVEKVSVSSTKSTNPGKGTTKAGKQTT